jgi:ATP-dependent DNA helicase RecQ
MIPVDMRAHEGRALSRWNDTGWGKMVADDKHNGAFRDELVAAVAEMITKRWRPDPPPQWVTCVPSLLHPQLVPDFARRLAARLDLPFKDVIRKVRPNEPQKAQQNEMNQCRNLDGVFAITPGLAATPVLLVDDMVDSGWTLTALAVLLRRAGAGPVFPVTLASTTSYL